MDGLVYTALSGMRSSMEQQRVLASNMANADTIGFRAEVMDARAVTITNGDGFEARVLQQALVRGADMSAGELRLTGRDLDVAFDGDVMMSVQSPDGTEAYTKRGDLQVSAGGVLSNGAGHIVLGESGPITIPPGGVASIAPDGKIFVSDPSAPDAPPQEIGQMKLVSTNGSDIIKGLDNLFRVQDGGVLPSDLDAKLQTGYLESSNVKMTEVLVEMVDQQRLFEMRTKLIATARELDQEGAQLMRLG